MSPRLVTSVLAPLTAAALLVSAGCSGDATPSTVQGDGPPASTARIGLVEWGFTSSASALVAGPVELAVTNAGSTPHDVQLLVDGEVVARTAILRPGEQQTVRADLTGADTAAVSLLCTLPGHESQGMAQDIEVVGDAATEATERQPG